MIAPGLVVGYHGCDRRLAEAVVLGSERLQPSGNAHDWLGHGIDFWHDDEAGHGLGPRSCIGGAAPAQRKRRCSAR